LPTGSLPTQIQLFEWQIALVARSGRVTPDVCAQTRPRRSGAILVGLAA
jgi:hypothetical protein